MGAYSNPLETLTLGMPPDTPTDPQPAVAITTSAPAPVPTPFPTTQGLMDYTKILGMPIGMAGSLLGGMVCKDELCHRGTILTVAAAIGYYGYTRKDVVGWALVVSAASAAIFTLFDAPRVTPVPRAMAQ